MSDISANNKRIAKNSIFMSIRMIIILIISLYSSRVLLDALGVEDFGIYGVVGGIVTMFTFFNGSLANGIQRFYNFELGRNGHDGANKVFNAAILIQASLALIIIVPTELIGLWYLHNKLVLPIERMFAAECIFHLSVFSFFINVLQVPFNAAVMAHEHMNFFALISVLHSLFIFLGVLSLPYLHGDLLIIYGIIIALAAIFQCFYYIVYCKKNFNEVYLKRGLKKQMIHEMASFSGWNLFGTFGLMLKDQGVNLILNYFFGPVVNASRAIAYQVNSGLQNFVSNITVPVRPQVVQSYALGDYHRSYNLTFTISKMSCIVLLMMSLPVLLEINYVLNIWLGDNVPEGTHVFVIIIVLNSFLTNLNGAIAGVVHASGKMKYYQIAGGITNVISVAFVYILVYYFRLPVIAFLTIFVMDIVRQIIALCILRKIDNNRLSYIEYGRRVLLPIFIVSAISFVVSYMFHNILPEGFIRLLIVTIVTISSVCLAVYFCGLTSSERELIKQLLCKIYK